MKHLFRGRYEPDYRKELDKRGILVPEEKDMKKDSLPARNENLNAFLGEGTTFKGNLTFEGTVRIDGKLEGEIFTKDTLVVGESSKIQATVHAGTLIVSGSVHGDITAEGKVELHSTARIFGNISTPSLVIAEGVIFEGSCKMGQKRRPEDKPVKEEQAPQLPRVLHTQG